MTRLFRGKFRLGSAKYTKIREKEYGNDREYKSLDREGLGWRQGLPCGSDLPPR